MAKSDLPLQIVRLSQIETCECCAGPISSRRAMRGMKPSRPPAVDNSIHRCRLLLVTGKSHASHMRMRISGAITGKVPWTYARDGGDKS